MTTLVKLYGELWNPDIVDWGSRGRGNSAQLLGDFRKEGKHFKRINLCDAQGIYVLYDGFRSVYVGKAFGTSIGKRLRDHLTDRLAGRWDMFSWYSTSTFRKGTQDLRQAGQRNIKPETIINTLEAISILIADPALNRKRESLPDAIEVIQSSSPHPNTIRHYLETILQEIRKTPDVEEEQ